MVDLRSDVYGEELVRIAVGQGLYTSELPSNIPDGFVQKAFNLVATGDSLENRPGIRQASVAWHVANSQYFEPFVFSFSQHVRNDGAGIALAWANPETNILNLIRLGTSGGGDGYMQVTMPEAGTIVGLCNYNNITYIANAGSTRLFKVSSLDWGADSMTLTSIPTAAPALGGRSLHGLFTFKDRLWGFNDNRLYFSEIAATGGLPETWSATNYLVFTGPQGTSRIVWVVPLTNKLVVFTETGAYSLMVEGEPSSWIRRTLDASSNSLSTHVGFESRGIIYYVNSNGVFATNGQSVAKLSGPIEDQFFLAKGTRKATLFPYEDGMILSITKLLDTGQSDAVNTKIFYSKLDPVGWTEWNIENGDGSTNSFGENRLVGLFGISDKMATGLNTDPVVYAIAGVSDSKSDSPQNTRYQLVVFDGGENQLRNRVGDVVTQPVSCVFKTKYLDAGNPFRNKQNKEGLLEVYTSDVQHQIKTSWDMDATTGITSEVRTTETIGFTVGQGSNLIRIPADFWFRRCAFTFLSKLQTNTSQVKIKDLAIKIDTGRSEAEIIR